jgi:aldehyde dehydrogenase (NAD+)
MKDMLQETERAWAQRWLTAEKKQYIDGEWVRGAGADWKVMNPATGKPLCTIALADADQVETAAVAANRCHRSEVWSRKTSRKTRADLLNAIARLIRENVEKLSLLESLANGKTYAEALVDDIPTCADIFEYYAGWTDKYYGEVSPVEDGFLNFTSKEPVGVCALIAPWNFPLYQASLKIAPALAMGNTVVMKPSEFTPLATLYLFELIDRHLDLPKGLLNLVLTDGEAANHLTLSRNVHKVSFTGSTVVGRKIVQNSGVSNLKAVTLELGGKSPCIFFEDTPNLDAAIDRAFTVMFSHKGEKCSEPTRFLIQKGIYDYVMERLIAKAEAVRCGDPLARKPSRVRSATRHSSAASWIISRSAKPRPSLSPAVATTARAKTPPAFSFAPPSSPTCRRPPASCRRRFLGPCFPARPSRRRKRRWRLPMTRPMASPPASIPAM